jgi:large subunit ribosomal protein L6
VLPLKDLRREITIPVKRLINIEVKGDEVFVTRKNESKQAKSLHGTIRSLISNAVFGVTQGYSKTLKLVGTGYRANPNGKNISISLGFSHPIEIAAVDGIEYKLEGQDTIIVSGIDKQSVGQITADIRSKRPPEPYKGKGIRYADEQVVRKAGKTAKASE